MIGVSVITSMTLPAASTANVIILKKFYLCYHTAELTSKFVYLAQQPVTAENAGTITAQWVLSSIDLTQTVLFALEVANSVG